MSDRVLVAYDGSPPAQQALEYAFETFPDAEITALYVVAIPEGRSGAIDGPEIRLPIAEKAREYAQRVLEGAGEIADGAGREIETDLTVGKPDHRIVNRAQEGAYDAIVVGSHGRAPARFLLGSVAEDVVRRSPVPVVVVR